MPAPKRRAKKRVTITREDAVRRIDYMIGPILENVEIALATNAAFQSANDIVWSIRKGGDEAHFYRAIMGSLALNLALTVARLFDPGSKRFHTNKRSVASIPLMLPPPPAPRRRSTSSCGADGEQVHRVGSIARRSCLAQQCNSHDASPADRKFPWQPRMAQP